MPLLINRVEFFVSSSAASLIPATSVCGNLLMPFKNKTIPAESFATFVPITDNARYFIAFDFAR